MSFGCIRNGAELWRESLVKSNFDLVIIFFFLTPKIFYTCDHLVQIILLLVAANIFTVTLFNYIKSTQISFRRVRARYGNTWYVH